MSFLRRFAATQPHSRAGRGSASVPTVLCPAGYPGIPPPPPGNAPRRRFGLWGGGGDTGHSGGDSASAEEPSEGRRVRRNRGRERKLPLDTVARLPGGVCTPPAAGSSLGCPPEMGCPGVPRCALAPMLLPFLALLATAGGQGFCSGYREQAVAAGGELLLLLEKPPQGWVKVHWRVRLDTGDQRRILTADRNKTPEFSNNPFLGRIIFRPENLSLQISRVTTADSGLYWADFEATSGARTPLCFRVSVWEPLGQPLLETRILHQEQDRCNLSLLCAVPGATSVSYSWSCNGGPPGALEPQPRLHLQVPRDSDPTVCLCNATNPVSWSTATTDVRAFCPPMGPGASWSYCSVKGMFCLLVLGSLGTAVAITHLLVRQQGPPSHGAPSNLGTG